MEPTMGVDRLTDDYGRSMHRPEGAHPVTADGRLLYVGPVLPHHTHEFFLDGVKLGCTTLEQAMELYSRQVKAVHGGYQPKGGMCMSCAQWRANCRELPFSTMPVIETTRAGVRVVRCTAHVRANQ